MDVPSERPEVGWSASAHANMITGNAFPAKLTRHCEVFFIVFLDKLFLVGAPYIQYVFRVRDRDMYIGARAREREREGEMIMIKSKERKHSYRENEERASLNCPSISPLSFTVFKLYNNLNSVHDIKKGRCVKT